MDYSSLRDKFLSPPREYGPTPFWALNNDLNPESLARILEECRMRGLAGVFMHPRTGMEVEYLSETFWERMGFIIEKCAELELKAWIYDEYNWPSGPAAGKLLTEHPEFTQKYLDYLWADKKRPGSLVRHPGKALAAFLVGHRIENISERIEDGRLSAPGGLSGRLLVFYEAEVTDRMFVTSNAPWCKYRIGYLDLMNPAAVQAFMDITHREYEKRFGKHFGKTIPGVFTDEPQNYRGFPWTGRFQEEFKARKGYDILSRVYELIIDRGDFRLCRQEFYEVAESLFAESFYEPIGEWCRERGLIFTGHLGLEERLSEVCSNHGGLYRAYHAMQMPGIDALGDGNGFGGGLANMEAPHFSPKAASSIAHSSGRARVLCEAGGGCGWQTTLHRLKMQLDWLFGTGVNFINPHHMLTSLKGLRKRDFPPTHYIQEPWWQYYEHHARYIQRLSFLLSQGVHCADILLYVPVETLHALHRGRRRENRESNQVTQAFEATTSALLKHQRDFDFLFAETIKEGNVRIEKDRLRIKDERFAALIIPRLEFLDRAAAELLARFIEHGGRAIALGPLPQKDEGGEDLTGTMVRLFRNEKTASRVIHVPDYVAGKEELIIEALNRIQTPDFQAQGILARDLIYLHREIDGTDIYFVANLSGHAGKMTLLFRSEKGCLEVWHPLTGKAERAPFDRRIKGNIRTAYYFKPGESVLFIISRKIKPLPFQDADFSILTADADHMIGFSDKEEAVVKVESEYITQKAKSPERPLELPELWEIRPEARNTWVLEPWKVKCERQKPLPVSRLKSGVPGGHEFHFSRQTRMIIYLGRILLPLANLILRPEKKYRHERYLSFGNIERLYDPASKVLGIDIHRLGLYQTIDTLLRISEYLDIRTLFRVFPPPGKPYEASTTFELDYIPDDLELIYEDLGEEVELFLNNERITENPRSEFLWDECNRAVAIADRVGPGKNTLTVKSRQLEWPCMAPNLHGLEFFVLRGSFEVRQNRMLKPAGEPGPLGDWREQGYPSYSGFITYQQSFDIPANYLKYHLVLECDTVHETLELTVNGNPAGLCLGPPFHLDVSGFVKEGGNEFTLRVGNTAANLLGRPRASGLIGPVRIRPYNRFEFSLKKK